MGEKRTYFTDAFGNGNKHLIELQVHGMSPVYLPRCRRGPIALIPWAAVLVAKRIRQGFDTLYRCRNALAKRNKMTKRSYHKLNCRTTNLSPNHP